MKNKNKHIVVRYKMLPAKGVNTSRKGWMDDPKNIQWDEEFTMTVGLKEKDHLTAQVILDVDDQKVIKNWKANDNDDKEDKYSGFNGLMEYYLKNYADYMTRFVQAANRQKELENG